jgi:hypothetical protein
MISLIESFAGGVCFGLGAAFAVILCALVIRRGDKQAHAAVKEHYKSVEERLARQADAVVQIATMMDEQRRK